MQSTKQHQQFKEIDNSDDIIVGTMALIAMYQAVILFLLQLLVFIPMLIIDLFLESQKVDKELKDILMISFFILWQLILISIIAYQGKIKYLKQMQKLKKHINNNSKNNQFIFYTVISEKNLETSFAIAAGIGIIYGLMIGVQMNALKIMLIVVEGFAVLFFLIFIIIRFLITKRIRVTSVLCLALSFLAIWTFFS